jgi:predicted nucleic acid-binding protein
MIFVVDASIALSWVFADEANEVSSQLRRNLGEGDKAVVPPLWYWEIANVLLSAERNKRITSADAHHHLKLLSTFPIDSDPLSASEAWRTTHHLARAHKLTSYDAAYLELAIRRGLPLATFDVALRLAASRENVELLPSKS